MLLNNVDVEPRLFARFQKRVFSARICEGESVAPTRPTNGMEGLREASCLTPSRGRRRDPGAAFWKRNLGGVKSLQPRSVGIRAHGGRLPRRIGGVADDGGYRLDATDGRR